MLTLALIDAELELVPNAIRGHNQVISSAQRVGTRTNKMLLDSSLHYAAMRKLEDGDRRGRPDLVHLFLLNALESVANKAGRLNVLIHTRNRELIRIDPSTRLVRNYNRFCGLMQQLFETGQVPPDKPLLRLQKDVTVAEMIAEAKPDRVIVMDETGQPTAPWQTFDGTGAQEHVLVLIGGFPSGTFRSELPAGDRVSFGKEQLTVWTIAAELLVNYERAMALRLP